MLDYFFISYCIELVSTAYLYISVNIIIALSYKYCIHPIWTLCMLWEENTSIFFLAHWTFSYCCSSCILHSHHVNKQYMNHSLFLFKLIMTNCLDGVANCQHSTFECTCMHITVVSILDGLCVVSSICSFHSLNSCFDLNVKSCVPITYYKYVHVNIPLTFFILT